MVKSPWQFIKKINDIGNSYFNDRKKILNDVNHLKKDIESLKNQNIKINKRYDTIEAYLNKLFEEFEIEKKYCPICERVSDVFLPFSRFRRYNAVCPYCSSLERHRQVYLYLKNKTNIFKENIKLLHFAPEPIFHEIFSESNNIDYWPVDLFRDDSYIREKVDIENIHYKDNSFDVIFNIHVLEHVPDDKKAMEELYRVIKPQSEGGFVVTMVPISYNIDETLEKKEYDTRELRLKYYGQPNHLRKYGKNFSKRMESVGFHVETYTPENLIGENLIEKYGLLNEEIFISKK